MARHGLTFFRWLWGWQPSGYVSRSWTSTAAHAGGRTQYVYGPRDESVCNTFTQLRENWTSEHIYAKYNSKPLFYHEHLDFSYRAWPKTHSKTFKSLQWSRLFMTHLTQNRVPIQFKTSILLQTCRLFVKRLTRKHTPELTTGLTDVDFSWHIWFRTQTLKPSTRILIYSSHLRNAFFTFTHFHSHIFHIKAPLLMHSAHLRIVSSCDPNYALRNLQLTSNISTFCN